MMIEAVYRLLDRPRTTPLAVSEILTEAGLSTRSFYRHFRSKDSLLLAVFEGESERARDDLDAAIGRSADPVGALRQWVAFYHSMTANPRRRRRVRIILSPEITRATGYAAAQARTQEALHARLTRILEDGARTGLFRHTRPEVDAIFIQDVVSSLVARARDGIEFDDPDETLNGLQDFVARAVGAPRAEDAGLGSASSPES
jgi:AcrR family transcriptional regulator